MTSSIFSAVEMAPRDPILGLNEAFNADTRTTKVNLGVGVYFDDNGKIPLLEAVKVAEKARLEAERKARESANQPSTAVMTAKYTDGGISWTYAKTAEYGFKVVYSATNTTPRSGHGRSHLGTAA